VDSQTPGDKNNGVSKAYRYVDIRGLYEALLDLFATEYPCVNNPIETFSLLAHLLDTDFSAAFPGFLRISRRKIWEAFSELHCSPEQQKESGHLLFTPTTLQTLTLKKAGETRARSKKREYPASLVGILGGENTVKALLMMNHHIFHFSIDMPRVSRFLLLLCQRPLIDDMSELKLHTSHNPLLPKTTLRPFYEDAGVLSLHAKDILAAIRECKREQEEAAKMPAFLTKMMSSSSTQTTSTPMLDKSFRPTLASIGVAIKTNPLQRFDKTVIKRLSSKEIPPNYGIPTQAELNARLARTCWIMNYLQNGGVSNRASSGHCATMPLETTISCHGWVRKLHSSNDSLCFNCAYYEHECKRTGDTALNAFIIEETTQVQV
jgi:hypothetical protein